MTAALFRYLLQANIAFILLYAYYALCARGNTALALRRVLLLVLPLAAALLPAVAAWQPVTESPVATLAVIALPAIAVGRAATDSHEAAPLVSLIVYALPAVFLLLRTAVTTALLLVRIRRLPCRSYGGHVVRLLPADRGAFSFFRYICLPFGSPVAGPADFQIAHEAAHARMGHSFDVLWSEVVCAIAWCNPFVWLWRRELRLVHEFQADRVVCSTCGNRRSYQFSLLHNTRSEAAALSNTFNVSFLKSRIKMMNKKKTSAGRQASFLLLAPLAAGICLLFVPARAENVRTSQPANHNVSQQVPATGSMADVSPATAPTAVGNAPASHTATAGMQAETAPAAAAAILPAAADTVIPADRDEEVLDTAEQPPRYPGGETALLRDIMANVKYPASAMEQKIQGTVVLRFVISKDGKVGKVTVLRSLNKECDQAAVDAIRKLKQFTPGKQKGKPVAVFFTVPIRFVLP